MTVTEAPRAKRRGGIRFVEPSPTALYYDEIDSPVGRLLLVGEEGALRALYMAGAKHVPELPSEATPDSAPFDAAEAQLEEYFAGERRSFDLVLAPVGSTFQRDVWRALAEIPYGTTSSYGEIAAEIGRPQAARAVGAANGRNPISIVVPCHRVVGADGSLTGYAGGLEKKERLLALEQGRR